MIILNQDKDTIINLDNIVSIFITDAWEDKCGTLIKATDISGNNTILGYYKKEMRAKVILKEIAYYIGTLKYYKYTSDAVKKEITKDLITDEIMFNTYEMPKE